MHLMVHLYENRESILEALHALPGWARPEPTKPKVAEETHKRLPAPHTVPFVVAIDGYVTTN